MAPKNINEVMLTHLEYIRRKQDEHDFRLSKIDDKLDEGTGKIRSIREMSYSAHKRIDVMDKRYWATITLIVAIVSVVVLIIQQVS